MRASSPQPGHRSCDRQVVLRDCAPGLAVEAKRHKSSAMLNWEMGGHRVGILGLARNEIPKILNKSQRSMCKIENGENGGVVQLLVPHR